MRLIFIRHGQSEANVNYDVLETVDDPQVPLTDKGHHDATDAGLKLKEMLKGENIHRDVSFVVSPWLRARQTFNVIRGVLMHWRDITGTVNPLVTEHYMNLVGNPENWAKFKTRQALDWTLDGQMDIEYEGGETLQQCHDRAKEFMKLAEEGHYGEIVVCVSHGQFIKAATGNGHHPHNGEIVEVQWKKKT